MVNLVTEMHLESSQQTSVHMCVCSVVFVYICVH